MVIVIKDHLDYIEIPNIKLYKDNALYDDQGLQILMQNLEPGIYKMKILERERFKGQHGDYGSWQVPPYYCVSNANFTKISSIDKTYLTPGAMKHRARDNISKSIAKLQKWLSKYDTQNNIYVLYRGWNNNLIFGSKDTKDSWSHKPIKDFERGVTKNKLKQIRLFILQYFNSKEVNNE